MFYLLRFQFNKVDVKSSRRFKFIPKEKLLSQNIKLDFNSEITERALGLLRSVKNDKPTSQHSPKSLPNTKRGILNLVASIFYPLGIVAHAVLEAKLIIQSLWKLKVNWDDNTPKDKLQGYQQWLGELHHIKEISINCWFSVGVGKKNQI